MVAYSFRPRFVVPISLGLGIAYRLDDVCDINAKPKRQTIRAVGKRRHARVGEVLQLYTGMRTKQCRSIGVAKCISVEPITIKVPLDDAWLAVKIGDGEEMEADDAFASADGFGSIEDMWLFWRKEHPDVRIFTGLLIQWEPIR